MKNSICFTHFYLIIVLHINKLLCVCVCVWDKWKGKKRNDQKVWKNISSTMLRRSQPHHRFRLFVILLFLQKNYIQIVCALVKLVRLKWCISTFFRSATLYFIRFFCFLPFFSSVVPCIQFIFLHSTCSSCSLCQHNYSYIRRRWWTSKTCNSKENLTNIFTSC